MKNVEMENKTGNIGKLAPTPGAIRNTSDHIDTAPDGILIRFHSHISSQY